jgi:hypothetical protein
MNVEIGAEAALFPEKEYINGIAFAVQVEKCSFCEIKYLRMSGKCKQGGIVGVVILMGGGAAIIIVLNDLSPFQGLQKLFPKSFQRRERGWRKKTH